MTKREIYDWLQMHHPDLNETVLEKLVNRALDIFCEETEILKDIVTIEGGTVSNQRYYDINEDVLKIKEMRISELPIPRVMDTGMIDSTIPTGSTLQDIGGIVTGTGTDANTIGRNPIEGAAYFDNFHDIRDGSLNRLNHNPVQYIDFADTIFSEVSNTSAMSMSVWVKFDGSDYYNTGTIINNYGYDPSNGRCGLYFTGEDRIRQGGWSTPLKHFLPNSFQAEFSAKMSGGWDSASNINLNKNGVAHKGWGFNSRATKNDEKGRVHDEWFLLTLSYDGTANGNGLRFYINDQLSGTHDTSFYKESTNDTVGQYFGKKRHWGGNAGQSHIGSSSVVKTTPGSSTLYYGASYTKWTTLQLGATLHPGDNSGTVPTDILNIYGNNMSGAQRAGRSYIAYPEDSVVYPFSGYMRNFMVTNHSITPAEHLSLYKQGITSLTKVKDVITEANVKHFYSLKSNATDEVGSINGTLKNNLSFKDIKINTASDTRGNK